MDTPVVEAEGVLLPLILFAVSKGVTVLAVGGFSLGVFNGRARRVLLGLGGAVATGRAPFGDFDARVRRVLFVLGRVVAAVVASSFSFCFQSVVARAASSFSFRFQYPGKYGRRSARAVGSAMLRKKLG